MKDLLDERAELAVYDPQVGLSCQQCLTILLQTLVLICVFVRSHVSIHANTCVIHDLFCCSRFDALVLLVCVSIFFFHWLSPSLSTCHGDSWGGGVPRTLTAAPFLSLIMLDNNPHSHHLSASFPSLSLFLHCLLVVHIGLPSLLSSKSQTSILLACYKYLDERCYTVFIYCYLLL